MDKDIKVTQETMVVVQEQIEQVVAMVQVQQIQEWLLSDIQMLFQ